MRSSLEHAISPNYTELEIVLAVSCVMGIPSGQFYTKKHIPEAKIARNVCMYLINMKMTMSYMAISRYFGLRQDESTSDAIRRVRREFNSADGVMFSIVEKVLGIIG